MSISVENIAGFRAARIARGVLVAWKDQVEREDIVRALRTDGYPVDSVATAHEAFKVLERIRWPLLIADDCLDDMSVVDLCKTVDYFAILGLRAPQVVAVAEFSPTRLDSQSTHLAAWIRKPLQLKELCVTVKRLLS